MTIAAVFTAASGLTPAWCHIDQEACHAACELLRAVGASEMDIAAQVAELEAQREGTGSAPLRVPKVAIEDEAPQAASDELADIINRLDAMAEDATPSHSVDMIAEARDCLAQAVDAWDDAADAPEDDDSE